MKGPFRGEDALDTPGGLCQGVWERRVELRVGPGFAPLPPLPCQGPSEG